MEQRERYTHMQHNIRKHFKLSMEEYAVLDAIYCLSRNQSCDAKADYFIELFDLKRRTYFDIKKSLADKQLIQKSKNGVKTTKVWDDAMAGRVAPWVDPSAEDSSKQEPTPPEAPDNKENLEKTNSAEIALCENCLKTVQNLHSKEINSAEIAPQLCKNCTQLMQNLHSGCAKIALHNTDINIVINNEINTIPVPAGTEPFKEILVIFKKGFETITGEPWVIDDKQANHIKLLEKRYLQNPEKFVNYTRLFFWLITKSNNLYWTKFSFLPSIFNSLWNSIVSYKPSEDQIKREWQKNKTDEELIIENYGNCTDEELDYLLRHTVICKTDYDLLKGRKLGATA